MKLAKYLADYIEHEMADNSDLTMQEVIQQGLEAFASTELKIVCVMGRDGKTPQELFS